MEDDRTRRRDVQAQKPAKQARQAPAALFVEPKIPSSRPPTGEPAPEAREAAPPTPEPAVAKKAEPPAKRATKAAAKKATPSKAAVTERTAAKPPANKPTEATPSKTASKATPTRPAKPAPAKAAKATAVKAAPTKAPTRAKKATPPPEPPPPQPIPTPLWEKIKSSPRYAPELLASAAVETLGRQVDGYVRWLVQTYPQATPDTVARYAAGRYARRSGYAILAGPAAAAAALIWAQARLVLLIAAAYGHDPTDPRRVPELLVLLGVHQDQATATAAVRAAGAGQADGPPSGWAGLARSLAGVSGTRRLLPRGANLLVGALLSGSATERVARRAIAQYRARS